ncbi:DUF4166 domain-containing protein [Sutcliffiella horikoshii]|uniref:DUF4166 domain-containing protein n=1 Tax=Sutcliffiella horikoshii TaxID=79883 RepID=A0A5D4SYK9_9BACI|nr:DUF4166 domain-containing protein [Sutcliffiella horikoshii]TYS67751.1 DUF4166 domain-containing protein [Sutcliffiella horikoshii]
MTIYQELLGEDFQRLHPKLQDRYALPIGKPFYGVGTMVKVKTGSPWLKPFLILSARWQFLFPESGKDVPFTIKNTSRSLPSGKTEIYWERTFHFEKISRNFNAYMTIDPKRKVVKDYLGEPHLFYSDLKMSVTREGRMRIRSGSQRFLAGKREIPIPRLLEGVVTVEEGYHDAREVYTIQVEIRNRMVGRVMAYEGEFKAQPL